MTSFSSAVTADTGMAFSPTVLFRTVEPLVGIADALMALAVAAAVLSLVITCARASFGQGDEERFEGARRIATVLIVIAALSFMGSLCSWAWSGLGGDAVTLKALGVIL